MKNSFEKRDYPHKEISKTFFYFLGMQIHACLKTFLFNTVNLVELRSEFALIFFTEPVTQLRGAHLEDECHAGFCKIHFSSRP